MLRIRELREARNINQLKLSMELNVTQAAISKYELGKSEPDLAMLCKIADYFHVSVDYLLGRDDNEKYLMTSEEQELLNDYRRLDHIQKSQLRGYVDGLLDR
ncbi:MAG: helix-turn-helix transcriptional regulator [Clostridia bacterium]|nr:helix-turn-helix transcriptional regulator [Clostridia bacterium]